MLDVCMFSCVDEGRGALAFTLGYRDQSITFPLRMGVGKGTENRLAIDVLQVAFQM